MVSAPYPPSTPLGYRAGDVMRGMAKFFDYSLPLFLIEQVYQRIPMRDRLFGGPSASADVAFLIRKNGGGAWAAISAASKIWETPLPGGPGNPGR